MTGIRTEPVTVNLGPQHPSTHGVFRLRVTFDGEEIIDLEPVFGYLHRGTEKLAETRNYTQIVTLTDRMDYVASMSNNLAYVRTVEDLSGIEVPERAQYIRVICAELQRIASHLMATGFLLNDIGALATPLIYCFREREKILDLFEMLCGARITLSYMRPGGVFQDADQDFWNALDILIQELPHYLDELETLISKNEIVLARTRSVGVLSDADAIDYGVTGPILRASRVKWDLRKANPYEIYDRIDFEVPIGVEGDTYDRFHVRLLEMQESVKIITQCITQIEKGSIRADVPYFIRPKPGETYQSVEGPKGELGFYLISDGGVSQYRCKLRAPSFINLTPLKKMILGWKMGDLITILGSIDIVLGEVDR